jgi:hypothetical protein
MTLRDFIDLELTKLEAYHKSGEYSNEKIKAAAMVLSQLCVLLRDYERLEKIASSLYRMGIYK